MASVRVLALMEQLEKHPQLLARMEQLLQIVDGEGENDIKRADDAEYAVSDNLQSFGNELLQEWSKSQESKLSKNFKQTIPNLKQHSKKNCTGTPATDK